MSQGQVALKAGTAKTKGHPPSGAVTAQARSGLGPNLIAAGLRWEAPLRSAGAT